MNNSDCIICFEHVDTCFSGQVIHNDLNLCVHRGEILALVGGSGSGKTTLLREMIGLQVPAAGCITVDGQRLAENDAYAQQCLRERCGVLFQGGALFSALDVFDNIALPLRELDMLDQPLIQQLVCHKLAMVGLDAKVAHRMPSELSGGMVKRVGLARALALEPEFLFLDEPTSGLDPVAGQQFVDLLRGLHRELGFTVVLVTHDLDTMVDLADRIGVLADQHIVALGRLNEVIASDHPFVHDFFGGTRGQRALVAQEAR